MSSPYPEMYPFEVNERLQRKDQLAIVDVREPDEFAAGHIPGAKNIPLGTIPGALNLIDPQQETIVVCQAGGRSTRACEYLSSLGYHVLNMVGGMSAWSGEID
ncbi:sulfurtransferase [Paenibacillus sp. 79R4]|uniref:rhodanese-like domain-containing protein n=1 Tax=Paenibacillus sp. 79R4 TaxID=2212847 RepID=UPI0015C169EF|nr:rhodanese-like domain-containing protein [Paenibacillus sp. 79R4]NWL89225.1 sulfurtransferase [Paenibacillus sp. 79R4]